MTICSVSRALIAAWVAGVLVTDLAHSELIGWIAAVAVGATVYLAWTRYTRSCGGACATPERPERPERTGISDR